MTPSKHINTEPATDELVNVLYRSLTDRNIPTPYSDNVLALIARIRAEQAENAVMQAALKPFAAAGRIIGTAWDGNSALTNQQYAPTVVMLTVGDLRRASSALLPQGEDK